MGGVGAHKCLDDLPQRGKRQVDIDTFFRTTSSCLSFLLPLRTSEIDQIQLTSFDLRLTVDDLLLLNSNHEDAVGAGRVLVHVSGANVPILTSN